MPDVHATAGDQIEVSITEPTAMKLIARMMTKGGDGKWEVELPGDPPMRGKISIDQYEWSHEGRCWQKRPEKAASVQTILKSIGSPSPIRC